MRRYTLIALFLFVGFGGSVAVAHANYVLPKHAKHCKTHYRKHVEHKHGKRVIECVKVATTKTVVPTPKTTAPTGMAIPQSPPTITPTATPTAVRASIDPDWTLAVTAPQAPPVPITFTYSANAGSSPLPDGELTLSIYVHASVSSAGGCEANVGGDVTSATCTVSLPAFGSYDLVTSYSSGVSDVAATGDTQTVDIEPPAPLAQTVIEQWGTTPPTNTLAIKALIIGTNAAITLTDPSFEGATSVGLTDNLGDTCTATVNETTATCAMTVTGVPSTFTVNYGGGTTQASSQTISPWGVPQQQEVDYQWPAQTVNEPHPTITVQTATVEWDGGYVRDNGTTITAQTWKTNPPNPLEITEGENVELTVTTIGSLLTDLTPLGAIDFQTTPNDGTWTTVNELPSGSADCTAASNYSLEGTGFCYYTFTQPGQYTVTPEYLTADSAYADSYGTPLVIDVTQ